MYGNSGGNDVSSGVVSGLAKQIVGGYGVPAVACAAYRHILSIRNMERFDSSGYGEDAITSYD